LSNYIQKQVYDDTQHIMGKLELPDLVRWQINRCNVTAAEPLMFNRNVIMLMNMLPADRLRLVKEKVKEYSDEIEEDVYVIKGGRKLGSPEKPFYINMPDDYNYDGGNPILVSPKRMKTQKINYDNLYTLILSQLEDAGLTWKHETIEIEGGSVEFTEEPKTDTPTPTYEEEKQ